MSFNELYKWHVFPRAQVQIPYEAYGSMSYVVHSKAMKVPRPPGAPSQVAINLREYLDQELNIEVPCH